MPGRYHNVVVVFLGTGFELSSAAKLARENFYHLPETWRDFLGHSEENFLKEKRKYIEASHLVRLSCILDSAFSGRCIASYWAGVCTADLARKMHLRHHQQGR